MSADGQRALVCSISRKEFWLCDVATGAVTTTFKKHPSDICEHRLLARLCPRLGDVPMQKLKVSRKDPLAVRAAVERVVRDCVGPLTPTGGIMNASFSDLLIRTADAFERSETDQARLATALNIRRNKNEAMVDWLRASLAPENVDPLVAALEKYFKHSHKDMITLVGAYERKWRGAWTSETPPDLKQTQAAVTEWLRNRPKWDATRPAMTGASDTAAGTKSLDSTFHKDTDPRHPLTAVANLVGHLAFLYFSRY